MIDIADVAERVDDGETIASIAAELGIPRKTLSDRLSRFRLSGDDFETTPPPDPDLTAEEIEANQRKRFSKLRAHHEAATWQPFKMKRLAPCAIVWFGDPHLDDDGCDWDALDRAVEFCQLPNVYGVGMGDYTNNWVGRLSRLYANQATSKAQGIKLAERFIRDRGIKWLTLIKGNHDLWSGAGDPLDYISGGVSDIKDWRAQFVLKWSNNARLAIDARHDFPGFSQYSEQFGAKKMALWDGRADLYVSAHRHCYGYERMHHPRRGTLHECFRVKGFKAFDSYAEHHGFSAIPGAEAMVTIIDPTTPQRAEDHYGGHTLKPYFRTFENVEEARDFWGWRNAA